MSFTVEFDADARTVSCQDMLGAPVYLATKAEADGYAGRLNKHFERFGQPHRTTIVESTEPVNCVYQGRLGWIKAL